MHRLLFQADDYGMCDSITSGILKGIEKGMIRNTGLMCNLPGSAYAAEQMQRYPHVCFGIDINLVAGKPCSDPSCVPHLVDEAGVFYSSTVMREKGGIVPVANPMEQNGNDPYPYEEVYVEAKKQIDQFVTWAKHKPGYLHGHSLVTASIAKALQELSIEYGIPLSFQQWKQNDLFMLPNDYNPKPFPVALQMETDVEQKVWERISMVLEHDISGIICHAGFVEEELSALSTFTVIRQKDLYMATSQRIQQFLKDHAVELITYRDLKG